MRRLHGLSLGVMCVLSGCKGIDLPTATDVDSPQTAFWEARLNYHAATLSTYTPWNTMQLSIVPLTVQGDTLPADSAIAQYESSDSNTVSVTSSGLVRAKVSASSVRIYTRFTLNNITYQDTVFVKVVDDPAPRTLDTFSIQPRPTDSAKTSISTFPYSISRFLKRTATDGTQMTELLVYYRSLNPIVARIDRQTGNLGPIATVKRTGPVTFVASVYAYGVARTDTLSFTMGYSLRMFTDFSTVSSPDRLSTETKVLVTPLRIGVGGEVSFRNNTSTNVSLVFDDTTNIRVARPTAPNEAVNWVIADGPTGGPLGTSIVVRKFLAPGEYVYHDANSRAIGKIIAVRE